MKRLSNSSRQRRIQSPRIVISGAAASFPIHKREVSTDDVMVWSTIHKCEVAEDELLLLFETMAEDAECGFDFGLVSPLLDAAEWLGVGETATTAIKCRNDGLLCLALVKVDLGVFFFVSGLRAEAR